MRFTLRKWFGFKCLLMLCPVKFEHPPGCIWVCEMKCAECGACKGLMT